MTRQRGQVLAFFALVLPIVLVPVVAFAIDAASLGARAASLQAAAAQAAEAGAQQIDAELLRASGLIAVDAAQARHVAAEVLNAEEPRATLRDVEIAGTTFTVNATERAELPFPWFEKEVTLRAGATARLASGYGSPSSRLLLPINTF